MFAKIVVGIVSTLVMFSLFGAIVWFGGPRVWDHFMAAETAFRELPIVQKQLSDLQAADKASADAAQKRCDARVQSTLKSAGTISRLAEPRARVGGAQPSLDAAAIGSLLQ